MKELIQLVVGILLTIMTAFFMSIVWKWFCVPLGAPVLSIAQCVGFQVIGRFLCPSAKPDEREIWQQFGSAFARDFCLFVIAAIAYWFT